MRAFLIGLALGLLLAACSIAPPPAAGPKEAMLLPPTVFAAPPPAAPDVHFTPSLLLAIAPGTAHAVDTPMPAAPAGTDPGAAQGVLRVIVAADGHVRQVMMVKSAGSAALDEAAVKAAAKWRFAPEKRQGRALPSRADVPFGFAPAGASEARAGT